MLTLRCTRRLLRRAGVSGKAETVPPTTVLGDWYANLIVARPQQLALCINERSLLVVILPARDFKNVAPRFRAQVVSLLARIGVPVSAIASEEVAMSEFRFGPTANRKVVGCLNQAAMVLSHERENPRFASIGELDDNLRGYIFSYTVYRQPRELALEMFAASDGSFGSTDTLTCSRAASDAVMQRIPEAYRLSPALSHWSRLKGKQMQPFVKLPMGPLT